MTIRDTYLAGLDAARPLVARAEVGQRWHEPSALREMTVGDLTGHLLRAMVPLVDALVADEPAGDPLTVGDYFVGALPSFEIDAPMNVAVRERARTQAAPGHQAVVAEWDRLRAWLGDELATQPPGRRLAVVGGRVMTVDEYLRSRLIELTVHVDDLAVSLGVVPPELPQGVRAEAITALVEVARRRHGDTAVMRGLARRERDDVDALRVL